MSTANTYLKVTELDFADIRANLKGFLQTQEQFKDYDYEGSAMATLLDVLAYNTHYNAFYVNMLANEMFLDTAQQRDSVVSRARELGYLPQSATGATASINVTFTGVDASLSSIIIPKHAAFNSRVDNYTYTFVTTEATTIVNVGGIFSADISITEGIPLTYTLTYSSSEKTKFIIPNINVDTSTIKVKVQSSSTDTTTTEFVRATNLTEIKSTSPVFFIEEAPDLKYEIVFGSGSLGTALKDGNVVTIEYLVCSGPETNGANRFAAGAIDIGTPYQSCLVATNTVARGGHYRESIDSIKFNAPRLYQTQNRAVVAEDYSRILLAENNDLQSVIAFGGEKADPPVFGKVFIAVKPYGEDFMTQSRKEQIKYSILDRTPLSIDPIIADPDYIYIIPEITTYYDSTSTVVKTGELQSNVLNAVKTYSENNLERFGNRLRYSRFVRSLDNLTDAYILNNEAKLSLEKRFTPSIQNVQKVTLKFSNALRRFSLLSTQFTYNNFLCYLSDDGNGNIDIFRYNLERVKTIVVASAGKINYNTGLVEIENFLPTAFSGIEIKVRAQPESLDIAPIREQILVIDSNSATVSVVGESV